MKNKKTTYLDELKHYVCMFAEGMIETFKTWDAENLMNHVYDGYFFAGHDLLWYLMNFASGHNENINWMGFHTQEIINWLNSPVEKSEGDLQPCPCCSGEAYLRRVGQCLPDYQIICEDCEFSTGTYKHEQQVIDIWNNLKGAKREKNENNR